MDPDTTRLKERLAGIAARHGLPAIGSVMLNQHGIEWTVDGYLCVPTLATIARRGLECVDPDHPEDIYPVIAPSSLSPALLDFLAETDRCTSKAILLLDTMPHLRPHSAHPDGHWIDGLTSPDRILLFMDAVRVQETVIAHEIGHIWIDVVEGCEDYRVLKDLSDTARVSQWTSVQSFVLDNKVNALLRERGFDMRVIEQDLDGALANLACAVVAGYRPPYAREGAFLAATLASAMLDRTISGKVALRGLDMASTAFRRTLPSVYELARGMSASVEKNGYAESGSIRKAISECALLSFAFIGEALDLKRDLVEEAPVERYHDKYPQYFPGLPVVAKLEIARTMARMRIPAGSGCRLIHSASGEVQAQFSLSAGAWTTPVPLRCMHPLPPGARHPNSLPLTKECPAPVGRTAPTIPTGVSIRSTRWARALFTKVGTTQTPAITAPDAVTGRGQRSYSAGLARFLSRVRLEEQLTGESAHSYAFNNPVIHTDPSGNIPCSVPPPTCKTYRGGPCAYAKHRGDDQGDEGGVVCCYGKKYICIWRANLPPNATPGIVQCIRQHERTHLPEIDCPASGYMRGTFKAGENPNLDECKAYAVEIRCYIRNRKRECGRLTGNKKAQCEANYHDYICNNACVFMKTTYKCPASMIPDACKSCP